MPGVNSREAIAALIYAYAERLDRGDLRGVAALFAGATYRGEGGGMFRGAEALFNTLERLIILYDGTPRTKHVTTNLTIEVDETRGIASARSYYTVFQATPMLPFQAIVAGRYEDQFARTDGQWHFSDRLVFVDLTGDLSQHLRVKLER